MSSAWKSKPATLADRIAQRTAHMFQNGLLDEARRLRDQGYDRTLPALTGVGYAETLAHLDGQLKLSEAIERTTIRTRQYARRQRTWFRHQLTPTVWRPPDTALKTARPPPRRRPPLAPGRRSRLKVHRSEPTPARQPPPPTS